MARIRSIKPEYWSDEQVASWPMVSRLAYIALWNEADDEGRLRANLLYLKGRMFPYDARLDLAAVLEPIIASGKMILYSADGQSYAWLPRFEEHQVINRPSKSRLPGPPPATETAPELPAHEPSVNTHGALSEDSVNAHGGASEDSRMAHAGKEGNRERSVTSHEGSVNARRGLRPRFTPPSLDEVRTYIAAMGYSFSPEKWHAHYQANGWRVGKNPMVDWQAACRTWASEAGNGGKPRQPDLLPVEEWGKDRPDGGRL